MRGLILSGLFLSLTVSTLQSQDPRSLPDETGWGAHVLALARAPDGAVWVGTYGQGIFVLPPGRRSWERHVDDDAEGSISWGFVHAFAFGSRGEIWYGTLGNGWGLSTDGGRTWKNWTFRMLGPEYQYVAPNGIVTRGDTVYIATADGVKISWDMGGTWHEITDSIGTKTASSMWGVIANQYVLSIAAAADGSLWLSHVHGIERSADGGRTWERYELPPPCERPECHDRARALLVDDDANLWVGTERRLLRRAEGDGRFVALPDPVTGAERDAAVQRLVEVGPGVVGVASIRGFALADNAVLYDWGLQRSQFATSVASRDDSTVFVGTMDGFGVSALTTGLNVQTVMVGEQAEAPRAPRHTWFQRPVALSDQPYIDQTYRYGSTMGGNFQQHQGVEFNAGAGTPVHAIGDGVVAHAAEAEAGSNTVVIRHDRTLEVDGREYFLYSTYYHNTAILVEAGEWVRAGDPISLVGNTGRATNDHLHLEVHATPVDSLRVVMDPEERYPPYTTNPELWMQPLPGTGTVAGRVVNAAGESVRQARIYGLVKGEPQETPFSFVETYGDRTRGTPAYGEHFAIGDVPPGVYVLGVDVDGQRVQRWITVEAGKLTWVVFEP
jgi:murein DD-endopeptidase MepM/ murein hydrolase activator NlpD